MPGRIVADKCGLKIMESQSCSNLELHFASDKLPSSPIQTLNDTLVAESCLASTQSKHKVLSRIWTELLIFSL
jgi:hypothetical protein